MNLLVSQKRCVTETEYAFVFHIGKPCLCIQSTSYMEIIGSIFCRANISSSVWQARATFHTVCHAPISLYIYVFVGLADQRNQRDTIIISIHSSHSCPLKCAALHHAHSFNVKRSLGFCGCVLEYFLRRTECYTNRISCSLPYMSDRTIDKQQEKLREYESWWCVDAVSFKYWRRMSLFCVGINDSVEPHDALSVIRICDRRSIHNLFIVSRNWNIPLSSFFTLSLSRVYLTKISNCQAKKKGETTIYH